MTKATTRSRIAHLADSDSADYEHIVHGVAHGEDELTHGLNGPKFWPADEVEAAAASLEGRPVYSSHGDGDRIEVGAVLRAAYQEGVGVVYEAGINDAEIAEELSLGKREVSIEAGNPRDVDRHEETGAAILRGYEYTALTTPERGASPGNYTAAGSAENNPAVAALSAAALEATLDGEDVDMGATLAANDLSIDAGALLAAMANPPRPDDPRGEVLGGDSTETNMTDTNDNDPDVEALLQRVDEKDERIESLEADLESKEAALEEKDEEIGDMADEVAEAKQAYAARLADHDPVNEEEDYVERFDLAELREKFEALDEDLAPDREPDVQSGGGGDGTDTAALEERLDEDDLAELRAAKDRYEHWEGKNDTIAQAEADSIAELAGADSFDDVDLEAI